VRKEKGEKGPRAPQKAPLGAQEEQVRREARWSNRGNNPPPAEDGGRGLGQDIYTADACRLGFEPCG